MLMVRKTKISYHLTKLDSFIISNQQPKKTNIIDPCDYDTNKDRFHSSFKFNLNHIFLLIIIHVKYSTSKILPIIYLMHLKLHDWR